MPKVSLRCPIEPSVAPVSHTLHPGEGFYQYVNQAWLKKEHINSWRSEFGVSDEIETKTDKELLSIVNGLDVPSTLEPKTSKEHLALLSSIWKNRNPVKEEEYIKICLQQLLLSEGSYSISKFFGWLCRSRISTIIEIVAQEETNHPYFVRMSLTPGALTLPLSYYTNLKLHQSDVWKFYLEYVYTCAIELNLPFLHYAINAECRLAKILNMPFSDLAKTLKGSSLEHWESEFEWDGFMEGLNLDKYWQSRLWTLDTPEQLKRILHWICTTDTQSVAAVLALHLITFASPYLKDTIKSKANKLFNNGLRGVTAEMPDDLQFIGDIKAILPDALCIVYADHQHDKAKLDSITNLVEKIRGAAVNVMAQTTVLSKKTRAATQEKIHRMRFKIGKGNCSIEIPKVVYYPECLLNTIISIQYARTLDFLKTAGRPSNEDTYIYPCFVANASYFSESNHIVLPWGILQWPFFCKEAPLGWNYGGIGATIAHEMTHGFDLEGSLYSPRAVYKEWWTQKNRNVFKKQTRKVEKFFGKFKHYGIPIDGRKTLSEDWADLGGVLISLEGLKDLLATKAVSDAERKDAYRNFFLAYAVSWRTLVRKEKMLYAMMTSVHAPAEDRVDRIVPQFQEWVDAFDIKETDTLFIPMAQRLKFF
jgi:putative endopeptidase